MRSVLTFLALLAFAGNATAAGKVEFVVGEVSAQAADGSRRTLARGAEIRPGDTVDTGSGRAQLRFTDGAMVSLSPGTQYRIDAYKFKGQPDGSEKGFFSLLKGAMRTITGAIGKTDRKAYRLDTAVATIGIRGTEYAVAYGNSITATTNAGSIEVCNSGGCLEVPAGQSAYVKDSATAPVLTTRSAMQPLAPPQPPSPPGFTAGDNPQVVPPQSPPPYQPPYQGAPCGRTC
jgi:hypothetical protein